MKNDIRIAAISSSILLLFFTILSFMGKLSANNYTVLIIITMGFFLAILFNRRLIEFDMSKAKIILSKIDEAQANLDATKKEIAEMYGGIEKLKMSPIILDKDKMSELGLKQGQLISSDAVMRYYVGCTKRERERLARIFVNSKTPDEVAQAILDGTLDDKIFIWAGPEKPLDGELESDSING